MAEMVMLVRKSQHLFLVRCILHTNGSNFYTTLTEPTSDGAQSDGEPQRLINTINNDKDPLHKQ